MKRPSAKPRSTRRRSWKNRNRGLTAMAKKNLDDSWDEGRYSLRKRRRLKENPLECNAVETIIIGMIKWFFFCVFCIGVSLVSTFLMANFVMSSMGYRR
jgi:hypothetical protein